MQSQVAAHLKIEVSQVLRVEEWSRVLFAVIAGKGGRFVSKKVLEMQEYTAYEVATKIAELINESDTIFHASVWDKKAGETRVYVSYPSKKGKKDCGMIRVTDSGLIERRLTLQAGTIEEIYAPAKSLKIKTVEQQAEKELTVPEKLAVGTFIKKDDRWFEVVSTESRYFNDDGYEVDEHDYAEICSTRYSSTLREVSLGQIAQRHERGQNVDPEAIHDAYKSGYLSMASAMNSDF